MYILKIIFPPLVTHLSSSEAKRQWSDVQSTIGGGCASFILIKYEVMDKGDEVKNPTLRTRSVIPKQRWFDEDTTSRFH